jgi:hypothetical protein
MIKDSKIGIMLGVELAISTARWFTSQNTLAKQVGKQMYLHTAIRRLVDLAF